MVSSWPEIVFLKIISKCNHNCDYCYSRDYTKKSSTKEIIRAVKFLSLNGVKGLVVTGGEPLLRKDFKIIVNEIKKRGMDLYLDTNGDYFFNHEKTINDNVSVLGLPLDFSNGRSYRSKKSNENILRILNYYKSRKGPKIRVGTVVTKDNISNLNNIAKVLKNFNIDQWKLYQVFKLEKTNSEKNIKKLRVSNKDFKAAVNNLKKSFPKLPILSSSKSSRNKAYFFIDSDLSVFIPCQKNIGGRIILGNLFDDGLINKWLDKVNKKKNTKNLKNTFKNI